MDEAPYNRMDYDTFMRIAGQFKAGEISADVMWFLLGFGPDHVSDIKEAKTAVVKRKFKYLLPWSQKRAAHIWTGKDTVCRMASTGGLDRSGYRVSSSPEGYRVCANCRAAGCGAA